MHNKFQNCTVTIIPDVIRLFGGSNEPSVQSTLHTIGGLSPENNINYSKDISDVISKGLGAKLDKIVIWFFDVESYNVGKSGTTVQELRK